MERMLDLISQLVHDAVRYIGGILGYKINPDALGSYKLHYLLYL